MRWSTRTPPDRRAPTAWIPDGPTADIRIGYERCSTLAQGLQSAPSRVEPGGTGAVALDTVCSTNGTDAGLPVNTWRPRPRRRSGTACWLDPALPSPAGKARDSLALKTLRHTSDPISSHDLDDTVSAWRRSIPVPCRAVPQADCTWLFPMSVPNEHWAPCSRAPEFVTGWEQWAFGSVTRGSPAKLSG